VKTFELLLDLYLVIITYRVKGYTRFVGKYVTGRSVSALVVD